MTNRSSLTKALVAVSIAAATALGLSACGGGTSDADSSFLTQLGDPQGKVMPTDQAIKAAHSFCDGMDGGNPVQAGLKLFSEYPAVIGYQNDKFTKASINVYCPQHQQDIDELQQSSGEADAAAESPAPPKPKTLHGGQSVTYTDDGDGGGPTTFKVSLDKLDQLTSATGYGLQTTDWATVHPDRGQFVVLELTIADLKGPQDGFFFTQPYYVGADGQRIENPAPSGGLMLKGYNDGDQDPNSHNVSPGQHFSGNMVFDVPNTTGKIVIPNEDNTPAFEIPLTPAAG